MGHFEIATVELNNMSVKSFTPDSWPKTFARTLLSEANDNAL